MIFKADTDYFFVQGYFILLGWMPVYFNTVSTFCSDDCYWAHFLVHN